MRVQLTPQELLTAAINGVMRRAGNIRRGTKHAHGYDGTNAWQNDVEGALAECALAKALGVYWSGAAHSNAPDVGRFEVRHTPRNNGHLIIYDTDDPQAIFVLVTGRDGQYNIRGGMYAHQAQQPKYWCDYANNGRWAYWLPQSALTWTPHQLMQLAAAKE